MIRAMAGDIEAPTGVNVGVVIVKVFVTNYTPGIRGWRESRKNNSPEK